MHIHTLQKILATTGHYILRLTYIQIVLAFVYIPVLVHWGMPISLMNIPGNIAFTPFFIACIFCAFFIFFLELFFIPNALFCTFFEYITHYWTTLLAHGSSTWLIGFANPGFFYLGLFTFVGMISLIISRTWRSLTRVFFVGVILAISMLALKYGTKKPASHTIASQKNTSCTLTQENDTICLTINNNRLRKKSFAKWFNNTVKKELYKTFGRGTVDTIKLIKPTQHTHNVIQENREIIGYHELIIG